MNRIRNREMREARFRRQLFLDCLVVLKEILFRGNACGGRLSYDQYAIQRHFESVKTSIEQALIGINISPTEERDVDRFVEFAILNKHLLHPRDWDHSDSDSELNDCGYESPFEF